MTFTPIRRLAPAACMLAAWLAGCGDSPSDSPEPLTPPQWLEANAHPIASLSVTSDFSDLEPLRAAIGSSRIVMLGEETHGDGTAFLAKARIIAFLHQRMGFDVLAWESGIYDVHEVWDHVRAGEGVIAASRRGVFGVWSRSEQVLPTLDYVAGTVGTARPLEMAGFDNQITGSLGRDSVAAHVLAFARSIGSRVADDPEWPDAAATLTELAVTQHYAFKPPVAAQASLLRLLGALRADASARAAGNREALFWTQALASIESYARMMWAAPPGQFRGEDNNVRDAQMAANLLWLADTYYPGRKIIVWAASAHIGRGVGALRSSTGSQPYATGWTVHMGGEVHRAIGAEMYSLGFTASAGSFGFQNGTVVPLPALVPGSLEEHFAATRFDNAYVDFRGRATGGEWLRDVYSWPFGYQPLRGDWTSVFDGMVFTRQMTPNTAASR
ncbi:MAG TPA: erythromycin esterase family protein [Longimicrobium sp.]|jgi:erythromycin esterase